MYPQQSPPPKKGGAKKVLWIVFAAVLGLCLLGSVVATLSSPSTTDSPESKSSEVSTTGPGATEEVEDAQEPDLTTPQEQAIGSAESYLDFSGFSREGLIDQLEYEGFSTEDAEFAVDHLGVDWGEQAVRVAESYLEYSNFSRSGLIDQLEYEGFTVEQAERGADAVGL